MFNQNSVPQIPGRGNSLTVSSGAGGQFPGVSHPMRMGLPTVPGEPTAQLASIGNVPFQMFPTGVTGLPSEQIPGLPAIGNLTLQLPSEIPSSLGFPGMASTGLPEIGGINSAPQTPGFPSSSFSAGILTQQDVSSNIETGQGLPRMPTSLTPWNLAVTGQVPLPGFAVGQVPSTTGSLSLGSSNLQTNPGMTGISVPGLPSGVPSVAGLPQTPGSFPTGITPPGLGTGTGLPSLPTESSQTGIAGFVLNPGQIPIGTQDSSFGESGGSMHQIPGLGTKVLPAVPQVNSGMLPPVSSQVVGIPTDITSPTGMVPTSTTVSFPGAAGLGVGGYGTIIPGSQVNSSMLPPGLSQAARMPKDLTSAAGMVPLSTSIGLPSRAMIPGPQDDFGMVPHDGLLPSSTAIPNGTQRLGDTVIPTNPYVGSVDEMGATKPQEMGLPPNMPNPDLLVRIDLIRSTL